MPEYRRFISYIYEYQSGRKEKNCGYVKVEIRNGACRLRLHMQCPGRTAGAFDVHAFVRGDEELRGILLGSASLTGGALDFQVSTLTDGVGGTEYSMEDVRGIWLRGEQQENYITVWDDEPVEVERFRLFVPGAASSDSDFEAARSVEAESEAAGDDGGSGAVAAAGRDAAEPADMCEPAGASAAQDASAGPAGGLWSRWDNFLRHYPQIRPFADDEIAQCIAIAPKDISYLARAEWQFMQNTFVRQAHMRYHHLMLGCHKSGRFVLAVPGTDDSQERHMARMHGFLYYKEADAVPAQEGEVCAAGEERRVRPRGYWYRFLNEKWPR